jgi:UDP-N-acetylmuramoyl-tripeptide--D-alanyl-D-alanine ligase
MLSLSECQEFTAGQWLLKPAALDALVSIESDSRKDCQSSLFVAFEGDKFDAHDFLEEVLLTGTQSLCIHKKPSQVVLDKAKEKGVGILLVEDTVKAYQDLASGKLKGSKCLLIGVTGSSGKTSVKSILSQFLELVAPGQVLSTAANTNNHIGVPQNLLRLEEYHKYAVIEMGTNNPGEIATLAQCAPADIAIITSIGDSHSGNFPRKNGILLEKIDIIRYMKKDAMAVVPLDLQELIGTTGVLEGRRVKTFGDCGADFNVEYIQGRLSGADLRIEGQNLQCSLSGRHQAQNIAACCLVMNQLGYQLDAYKIALSQLELPGMRMKILEEQGVTWVNDAYNANPQSTAAFIHWLEGLPEVYENFKNRYLVLGDMLELGDHSLSFHQEIIEKLPTGWIVLGVGENFSASHSSQLRLFSDSIEASEYLLPQLKSGDFVALKGSRGIRLEEIYNNFRN